MTTKEYINEVNKLRKDNKGKRVYYSAQIGNQIVHYQGIDTVIEKITHSGYDHSMVYGVKPTVKQFHDYIARVLKPLE